MSFKQAPYWHLGSSLSPVKIQLFYNCLDISALYLSLSILSAAILSTAILCYEKHLWGYNSPEVRGCMRIVPLGAEALKFHLSSILGISHVSFYYGGALFSASHKTFRQNQWQNLISQGMTQPLKSEGCFAFSCSPTSQSACVFQQQVDESWSRR